MNEEAINDLYSLAQSNGYDKSVDEFKTLVQTNANAVADMYELAKSNGYGKTPEDFQALIGFKKKVDSEDGSAESSADAPADYQPEEPTAVEEFFGKNAVTNFLGDIVRSYKSGAAKTNLVDPSQSIFGKTGSEMSDEELDEFIKYSQAMKNAPLTDEMKSFQKTVQERGGDWAAFFSSVWQNKEIIPQLVVDSFASMLPVTGEGASETLLTAGSAGAGAGGAAGAGIGLIGGPFAEVTVPVGATTGAVRGGMAALGGTLETMLSYNEFLSEELDSQGLEMTPDNIRKVTSDPETVKSLRNRALSRGLTIGAFDLLTAGISGRATGAVKSGVKSARAANAAAGATGLAIESTGGSAGEAAARLAAGQEMDIVDIGLEGVGEMGPGAVNVVTDLVKSPKYQINGERVTKKEFEDVVKTSDPKQIASMNLSVKNDDRMKAVVEDKRETAVIEQNISDAVTEPDDRTKLIDLEKRRKTLAGKQSQSAKNELKAVDQAIANITDKYASPKTNEALKNAPMYSIDGVMMDRAKTESAIKDAETLEELNEISIENDPEIQAIYDKKKRRLGGKVDVEQKPATKPSPLSETIRKVKESDPEKFWSVDEVSESDAKKGQIVEVDGGMGLVTKDGDIKGVVKKLGTKAKNVGRKVVDAAVKSGGIKLDNFDGKLTDIYKKAGFKVVSRTPFDEKMAPKEWSEEKHGRPDVVAMIYDPEDRIVAEEKEFKTYDEALAYRDSFVDQAKTQYPLEGTRPVDLRDMTGKSVTVKVGGKNVSGVIDVDEGGKVTLNRGKEVFDIDPSSEFTEFQRPVKVDTEGNFEYKGEKFPEARIVTEDGKRKAVFVRPDKSIVAVTNPDVVEEIDYQVSLANTETVKQKVGDTNVSVTSSPGTSEAIAKSLDSASKTLRLAFPGAQLIVGENLSDTRAKIENALTPVVGAEKARAIASGFSNDRGSAIFVNGKPVAVAINKEVAESTTAPHEIWHMVLRAAFGNDPKKFQEFRDSISNELINNGFEDIAAYLDDFSSEYEGDLSFEEYLAELGAQLTSGGIDAKKLSPSDKTLIERIKDVINKFAKALTGKEVFLNDATPENILQFMIDVSGMIARGEDVSKVIKATKSSEKGVSMAAQKQLPARIDSKISEIIATEKGKGSKPSEVAKKALEYVRGTDVFKSLTPREKQKVVDTTKRLAGMRVQVKTDEYAALKDQIKLEAKAARESAVSMKTALANIAATVKAKVSKGEISQYRAAAIIRKIAGTNLFSNVSIDATLDYISEIFKNSNLAYKIDTAKSLLPKAKKAIKTKIGQAKELYPVLRTLFSIDPSVIPTDHLGDYLDIVQDFGARDAILTLDLAGEYMAKAEAILNAVAEQQTEIDTDIEERTPPDPAIEEERGRQAIKDILDTDLNTSLITDPDEAKIAKKFKELKKSDLEALVSKKKDGTNNYANIYRIASIMQNIGNGYVSHQAAVLLSEIESNRSVAKLLPIVQKVTPQKIALGATRALGALKDKFTGRGAFLEQIRSSPTGFIDDLFGNFNSTEIYKATFGKLASAKGQLDAEIQIVSAKLNAADRLISKGKTDNAAVASKYKIMSYMLQREYEANPGEKGVAPASEFIDETLKAERAKNLQLGNKDIAILEGIKREFGTVDNEGNTQLSLEKMEQSMSPEEKKAIELIDSANQSLAGKALFTSSVIRGSRADLVNSYIHHEVAGGTAIDRVKAIEDKLLAGGLGRPSTKAGTLNERTPGAKAINFDPISSSYLGAKMTLTDYHMTQPVRDVFKTVNKIKNNIVDDPNSNKLQLESADALVRAIDETLRITFQNSFSEYSPLESGIAEIRKQGYFQVLASAPRAAAELGSNLTYTMKSPGLMMDGFKNYGSLVNYGEGLSIMQAIGSEASTRLYGNELLTGKYAEGGLFSGLRSGSPSKTKNDVLNIASFIHQLTTGKLIKANEIIADFLLSTPDKALSRPFYFAAFNQEFESITGKKLTASDFKKIGDGTSEYLGPEYSDAIEKARIKADRHITTMSASSNSFNTILKNAPRKEDTAFMSVLRAANSFMSRFYLTEFAVLRSATLSMLKSGDINKKQAMLTMGAVLTRMASYVVLYSVIKNMFDIAIARALGIEGPEEMDKEEILDEGMRAVVGTAVNTLTRRSIGNLPYIPIAIATEMLNEEYGGPLRSDEEYDAFENSIVFSGISKEDLQKNSAVENLFKVISGPYGPLTATVTRAGDLTYRAFINEKSKPETKERAIDELSTRMVLEAAGQTGIVPFYKDIRRIVINDLFSDIDKKSTKSDLPTKKEIEEIRKIDPKLARELEQIYKLNK